MEKHLFSCMRKRSEAGKKGGMGLWAEEDVLENGQNHLHALHLHKRPRKVAPRILQRAHTLPQQEIRRHIQRHPVKQVTHVDRLARGRHLAQHRARPAVKDVQVAHAVAREHGPDQRAALVPAVAVGREDAVAQERAPRVVEHVALAKVGELGRQHRLDVLGLARQQDAPAGERHFHDVGRRGRGVAVDGVEVVEEAVVGLHVGRLEEPVDGCISTTSGR